MPGIGVGIVLFAVGAILDFGVTVNSYQHGFNIHAIGVILMIVGAIAVLLSLLFWGVGGFGGWYGPRRHRTVVEDSRGAVVRDDMYQ